MGYSFTCLGSLNINAKVYCGWWHLVKGIEFDLGGTANPGTIWRCGPPANPLLSTRYFWFTCVSDFTFYFFKTGVHDEIIVHYCMNLGRLTFWYECRALTVLVHWLIVIAYGNRALRCDKHWATAYVVVHAGLTVPARAHFFAGY